MAQDNIQHSRKIMLAVSIMVTCLSNLHGRAFDRQKRKEVAAFITLCLPLMHMSNHQPSMRQRINPNEEFGHWVGVDVHKNFSTHPYEFFRVTGETVETFMDILITIAPALRQTRSGKLSPRNRLLMTLMWLKCYPTYPLLSLMFGVSLTTVSETVQEVWIILWQQYRLDIAWPTVEEWQSMGNELEFLDGVVGYIDGTSHEISIPEVEPQRLFYSGHRKFHCIHTQVVADVHRRIRYIHSGFPGHMNDAQTLALMPLISPDGPLNFPGDCWLLADAIYPCRHPTLPPYKSNQIIRAPAEIQLEMKKFNKIHKRNRVYIEIVIGYLKHFRVIGSVYRHPRHALARIVELCAALAERRVNLFENI